MTRWPIPADQWPQQCIFCHRNCRDGLAHRACLESSLKDAAGYAAWRQGTDNDWYVTYIDEAPTLLELWREIGLKP